MSFKVKNIQEYETLVQEFHDSIPKKNRKNLQLIIDYAIKTDSKWAETLTQALIIQYNINKVISNFKSL